MASRERAWYGLDIRRSRVPSSPASLSRPQWDAAHPSDALLKLHDGQNRRSRHIGATASERSVLTSYRMQIARTVMHCE
jgi:hypothetical protein